jgi:hypothetical protein
MTIHIPASLAGHTAPVSDFVPNTWNPNRMDAFMREKLQRAIETDGFIVPVLVRPNKREDVDAAWEIVDGEHRWNVGGELGMAEIPFVNLGDISDAQAKQITVKANALKGEFDSVKLAEMIHDLSKDIGIAELQEALPYTPERLQSMIDLLSFDAGQLGNQLGGLGDSDKPADKPGEGEKPGAGEGSNPADQFKSFNPDDMNFDCKCPRCGFQFNKPDEKKAA